MLRNNGIRRAVLLRDALDRIELCVCVAGEAINGDHGVDTMLPDVLDVGDEVRAPLLHEGDVLLGVLLAQRLAGHDLRGLATVQLQGADGADDDRAVRLEPAVVALDVEELLSAHVSAEARLCEHVPILADQLEAELIRDDGRVPVGDVREGPGVHERRCALERLHRVRRQGFHHQHRQRAGDAEVVGGEGLAGLRVATDHPPEAGAQVLQIGGQGQDGHDLGAHRDGEGRLAAQLHALPLGELAGALADCHLAQVLVVAVRDPLPRDCVGVDVQLDELLDLGLREQVRIVLLIFQTQLLETGMHGRLEGSLAPLVLWTQTIPHALDGRGVLVVPPRVDRCREKVVRRGDGMDVACHVQVELLHRHALRVPTAGSAALCAEGRAHGRLPDASENLLPEVRAQRLGQANRRRRLALT
mmetsp:Transcript_120999/g.338781  ORF Transcript_120999/g.338781 Transcript_120999/m.338781 type:complete len:416 (+) Transcript_120999:830-2077(+)